MWEVSVILFLVVVAPVWISMHYSTKKKKVAGLSEEEHARLEKLTEIADRMITRIETLESILDTESPGWRKKA